MFQHQSSIMALGVHPLFEASTTQKLALGTRITLQDGRAFRYGSVSSAGDVTQGKLVQSSAVSANYDNQPVTVAAAIDATKVSVTFGGAVTANLFQDGYMIVNDVDGEGGIYRVKSHAAGTTAVELTLYEPIRKALTTNSEVTLAINPYKNMIICPTTLTGGIGGVTVVDMNGSTNAAETFGWFQVAGPAAVLTNGTVVVGGTVEPSGTTAGAVDPTAETTFAAPIGTVMVVAASTEYSMVWLAIPGR